MRILRWVGAAALVFVLLLVVTFLWLRELDLSEQSQTLTSEVSGLIGRELQIEGSLRVGLSLWPKVVAEGVTLANASWGSRPTMLEAERVEFVLAIWPLLSGRIEVVRIEVEDVSVWVEPNAKGVVNWEIGAEDGSSDGSGVPEFDLRSIRADRARVIWRAAPESRWHRWRVRELEAQTEGERSPLSLKMRSRLDRNAVVLEGKIGSIPQITLGESFDVDLKGRWGAARVKTSGHIEDVSQLTGMKLDVSLEAEDLRSVPYLEEFPALGPLALDAHVEGESRTLGASKIRLRLGKSDVGGELRFAFSNREDLPVDLSGKLTSSVIDVAEIIDSFEDPESEDEDEDGEEVEQVQKSERLFSEEPLDLQELTRPGLDLSLDADEVRMRAASFEVTHAKLLVKDGRFRLAPVTGLFRGTRLEGELEIDGRGAKPRVQARLLGRDFDLGAWLERVDVTNRVAAKVDVAIDVRGTGDSLAAILASLDGSAAAAISDGRIPTQYVDVAVADLAKLLIPWSRPTKETDIECAVVQFVIDKGLADTKLMMFDTEKMTLTGHGEVNLRKETLDFVLAPRPRDTRLFSLATDVVLKGPIVDPSARPHAIGLASTLVRFAFGPTKLLDPFGLFGSKQHPCVDAVQEVAGGAAEREAKSQ